MLTHATFDVVKAALKVTTQLVIYSHTALSGPGTGNTSSDMSRRMMSKDEARMIMDAGGVLGVWFPGGQLGGGICRSDKGIPSTLLDVDHRRHRNR